MKNDPLFQLSLQINDAMHEIINTVTGNGPTSMALARHVQATGKAITELTIGELQAISAAVYEEMKDYFKVGSHA